MTFFFQQPVFNMNFTNNSSLNSSFPPTIVSCHKKQSRNGLVFSQSHSFWLPVLISRLAAVPSLLSFLQGIYFLKSHRKRILHHSNKYLQIVLCFMPEDPGTV